MFAVPSLRANTECFVRECRRCAAEGRLTPLWGLCEQPWGFAPQGPARDLLQEVLGAAPSLMASPPTPPNTSHLCSVVDFGGGFSLV